MDKRSPADAHIASILHRSRKLHFLHLLVWFSFAPLSIIGATKICKAWQGHAEGKVEKEINACANDDSERDTSTDGHSAGKGIHLFLGDVVGLAFE